MAKLEVTITSTDYVDDRHNPLYVEDHEEYLARFAEYNNTVAEAQAKYVLDAAEVEAQRLLTQAAYDVLKQAHDNDPENNPEPEEPTYPDLPSAPDLRNVKPPEPPPPAPTQTLERIGFTLSDGRSGYAYKRKGESTDDALSRAVSELPPPTDVQPGTVRQVSV